MLGGGGSGAFGWQYLFHKEIMCGPFFHILRVGVGL